MLQSAPPPPIPYSNRKLRRSLQFVLFAVSLLWYALSDALSGRAARGITNRFNLESARPLLSAFFLIFLLAVGFSLFESIGSSGKVRLRAALGLPRRPTVGAEWSLGAGIGWGMAVLAVLPMALGRALHVRFWTEPRAFILLALHIATLALATLAIEIALRGYPFRRLIGTFGTTWATVLMAIFLTGAHALSPESTTISILVTLLTSVLLSVAWLRTHGLWLSWGIHFAWNAVLAVFFGLPIRGITGFSAVIETRAVGRMWLTGGSFGPEGALLTVIVLVAAIVVVVRTTGDYAWDYTRPEIVAAGYEVNPAPPAAHTAMEQHAAARPPALVQILPTTSHTRSVTEENR